MPDPKKATIATYDAYADVYESRFQDHAHHILPFVDLFAGFVKGGRVLSAGCGAGITEDFLSTYGIDVVGLDMSAAFLRKCVKRKVRCVQADMEHLPFPPQQFDGVYTYTSLLHFPKSEVRKPLEELLRVLRPGGTLAIGLKEGEGEGFEAREHYGGHKRYFANYALDEWGRIMSDYPVELRFVQRNVRTPKAVFLQFIYELSGRPIRSACRV